MYRTLVTALCVSALAFVNLTGEARGENMKYMRFTIQNETGNNATDLHLRFYNNPDTATLDGIKIRPTVQPPGRNASGTINPNNGSIVDFPEGSFGTIKSGDKAYVDICVTVAPPKRNFPFVRWSESYWTLFGENIGPVTNRHNRVEIVEPAYKKASLEFSNTESYALQYTNLAVYGGNDLANLNIDDFATPTGSLIPGVPSSFVLNPGESVSFPLGDYEPSTSYILAVGQVASTADPENVFDLAVTTAVPEPSSLLLGCLGLLALPLIVRRR